MTRSATYHMRVMSQEELQSVLDWAALEGWNPGLHDAASFYAADPQGFWLGTLDHQPIASISAVKYGQNFGFVGLYIVKPEYRGQGYGLSLWNAALDSLGPRTLGLDGVVAQQENYKKSGFQLAHRNIRFAGVSRSPRTAVFEGVVELARVPFAALETHDRAFFPEAREAFLRAWITQPDSHALGVWEQQQLQGYGVIRACRTGYKIGPLNAESPEIAERLLEALIARIPVDVPVYWDVPEPNAPAVALAQQIGMEWVFETARMYRGALPALPLQRLFGITSFELG